MGYPIQPEEIDAAHARGAAEERAAVVAWLRQPDNDFGQAAPAIEAGEHRRDVKVEQAGPETRSWVQALTAKWPAGDPGEGHSGFCQHHLTGECAPGCHRREGEDCTCPFPRTTCPACDVACPACVAARLQHRREGEG